MTTKNIDIEKNDDSESDSDESESDSESSLLKEADSDVRLTAKGRQKLRRQLREDKLQQQVFEYIIKEQTKFKAALKETGKLPYPCECGSLCDYRPIIKQLVNAFDHLYETYENLYVDYYILFVSDRIIPEKKQGKLKFSRDIKKLVKNSNINISNTFGSSSKNFEQYNQNYKSIINKEDLDYHSQLYEQRFEEKFGELINDEDEAAKNYMKNIAKLQVIHNSRPRVLRFFKWIFSQLTGRKECFCFYCSDRENLDVYHLAIMALYKEYRDMYLDFLGLYYRQEIVERADDFISVIPTRRYYKAKARSEIFFKKTLEYIISK